MIRIENIQKVFNAGRPNAFTAVENVTLSIDSLTATALTGPSGSGKTTLLGILGCMARPTAGRIFLKEREITSLPERFLTEIRRRTFGFMFQQLHLIRGITALENIMIPAYPDGIAFPVLKKKAMDLLDLLKLPHRASEKVEWLSGGEAQRIAIARALINDPDIIVADEPTAHLDTHLSHEFMDIMRQLKDKGKTLLIASHDPIVFESEVIDRIIGMRDGRIISSGNAP